MLLLRPCASTDHPSKAPHFDAGQRRVQLRVERFTSRSEPLAPDDKHLEQSNLSGLITLAGELFVRRDEWKGRPVNGLRGLCRDQVSAVRATETRFQRDTPEGE